MLNTKKRYNGESGQTVIMFISVFAVFLMAAAAFAVSAAHLWMTKQRAQVAAEAACDAASMDMLNATKTGQPIPAAAGFSLGAGGTCGSASSGTICRYASDNGFAANGNNVNVSWYFPSSIAGTANVAPAGVAYPYLTVNVSQAVSTGFLGMFPGVPKTIPVSGASTCGVAVPLTTSTIPEPGVIFFATGSNGPDLVDADSTDGAGVGCTNGLCNTNNPSLLTILAGGQTSIYDNGSTWLESHGVRTASSESLGAFGAEVDISHANPNGTGGNAVSAATVNITNVITGATSTTQAGALQTGDPLSWLNESGFSVGNVSPHAPINVSYGQDGCPDHLGCTEYFPGAYAGLVLGTPSGYTPAITMYTSGGTAIFMPGEYYMTGPLNAYGEVLRNATPCKPSCGPVTSTSMQGLQPGEYGVIFYFADGGSGNYPTSDHMGVPYYDQGGGQSVGGPVVVSIDDPKDLSEVDPVPAQMLGCGGLPSGITSNSIPASGQLEGTVLMGECDSKGTFNYVNSGGASGPGVYDSTAPGRGILFFVSRSFQLGASIDITQYASPLVIDGTVYAFNTNYRDYATFLHIQNPANNTLDQTPPGLTKDVYFIGNVFVGGMELSAIDATVTPTDMYTSGSTSSDTLKAAQF